MSKQYTTFFVSDRKELSGRSLLKTIDVGMNLKIGDNIEIESAPNNVPLLTTHIVLDKKVKVSISGTVIYEYYVYASANTTKEQKHFINN